MSKEIYEDVLAEEPDTDKKKEYNQWEKRLHNSIGWVEPMVQDKVFITPREGKQPRIDSSPLGEQNIVWDVTTENGGFTCDDQEHSNILSLLFQMNERLKRIEREAKQ